MEKQKILFIVGPTASGKSDIALSCAERLDGEIVSCDSMQVYKEITIASNQPSEQDLSRIKHHLINEVSVYDEFDAVKYSRLALKAIEEIHERKKLPIVVGGSGMYVQVLLDGIFDGVKKDDKIRSKLEAKASDENGLDGLYQELKECDPESAERIHPHDAKRIIRALEVYEIQQVPISKLRTQRDGLWSKAQIIMVGLKADREQLYERINDRVEDMFLKGLLDEVKLIDLSRLSVTARSLIGIKEVVDCFDDACKIELAKELMKRNTRHLAKRQMTWFNKDKRVQWLDVDLTKGSKTIINTISEMVLSE